MTSSVFLIHFILAGGKENTWTASLISLKNESFPPIMAEEQLSSLHFSLGNYIRNEFGLWGSDEELLKACCPDSSLQNPDDASMVIIKALWWKLQSVH